MQLCFCLYSLHMWTPGFDINVLLRTYEGNAIYQRRKFYMCAREGGVFTRNQLWTLRGAFFVQPFHFWIFFFFSFFFFCNNNTEKKNKNLAANLYKKKLFLFLSNKEKIDKKSNWPRLKPDWKFRAQRLFFVFCFFFFCSFYNRFRFEPGEQSLSWTSTHRNSLSADDFEGKSAREAHGKCSFDLALLMRGNR